MSDTGHPLDAAAAAAYGAFSLSSACGEMPPWASLPDEIRADWRAVADAVQMYAELRAGAAGPEPPPPMSGDVKGKLDDAFQFAEPGGGSRHSYVSREWVETLLAHHAAGAVAAERERCAQLIEREINRPGPGGGLPGETLALQHVAALLRKDQP